MSICMKQKDSKTVQLSDKTKKSKSKMATPYYHSQYTIKLLKTTLKTKDVKVKDTSQNPVSIHKSNKYKYSV